MKKIKRKRKKRVTNTDFRKLSPEMQRKVAWHLDCSGKTVPGHSPNTPYNRKGVPTGSAFRVVKGKREYFGENDQAYKSFCSFSRKYLETLATWLTTASEMYQRGMLVCVYGILEAAVRTKNWVDESDALACSLNMWANAEIYEGFYHKEYRIGKPVVRKPIIHKCFQYLVWMGFLVPAEEGGYWINPAAIMFTSMENIVKNMPDELSQNTMFSLSMKTYRDTPEKKFLLRADFVRIMTNRQVLDNDAILFCLQPQVGTAFFLLLTRVRYADDQFAMNARWLAKKMRVSKRSALRYCHILEDKGLVAFGRAPSASKHKKKEKYIASRFTAGCIAITRAVCGRLDEFRLTKVLAVFKATSILDPIIDVFGWFRRRNDRREMNSPIKVLEHAAGKIHSMYPTMAPSLLLE